MALLHFQSTLKASFNKPSPTPQTHFHSLSKLSSAKPLSNSKPRSLSSEFRLSPSRLRNSVLSPSAVAAESDLDLDSSAEAFPETERLGVVVKAVDKPRLVLKFIWMEKNIGIALDQMIPGHGSIPLSPYYFWPRKDAWEELKTLLESKPWISQKQMIILLNQATDIINLWQQSGGNVA